MIIDRSTKRQQDLYDLYNKIVHECGFTSDNLTGRYIVAIDALYTCTVDEFNYGYLYAKLGKELDLTHVRGWVDTNTNIVYIDLVVGLNSLREATTLGKICKQIAIYDTIAEDVIYLNEE